MIDLRMAYTQNFLSGGTGASFAADISRRVAVSRDLPASEEGEGAAAPAPEKAEKLAQLQALEGALGGTVEYMASTHGDKAASTMVALVYKRIGENEITEASLGDALLDVTRFIDAAFGTDKGDAFMSHLNGTLNESMNAFFDNGANEEFFDTASIGGSSAGGVAGVTDMLAQLAEEYADSIQKMLEESRKSALSATPSLAAYGTPGLSGQLQGVLADLTV